MGRVVKMHPGEMLLEARTEAICHLRDREAGRDRRDQRIRRAGGVNLGEELLLQRHVFGEAFENEVRTGEHVRQVGVRRARDGVNNRLRLGDTLYLGERGLRLSNVTGNEGDFAPTGGEERRRARAHRAVCAKHNDLLQAYCWQ